MNLFRKISFGLLLIPLWIQAIAQNCPPTVVVNSPVTTGSNLSFQSSNSITGTSTIQNGATAVFDAGQEISLSPNFDALAGSSFDATIGGCSGSSGIPNDPYFAWQWGHQNLGQVPIYQFGVSPNNRTLGGTVDADADIIEAWGITTGSPNITIGVLDYGLDMGHPDISSTRIRDGYNFVHQNSNFQDIYGHGTLVTGIIAATANNGIGVAGIDQSCMIMPLKVGHDGSIGITNLRISQAIYHAINHQANILTMSFGGANQYLDTQDAFRDGIDSGMLIFAAAGNDSHGTMDFPAGYPSIVGVGAMSPCGERKDSVTNSTGSCDRDDRADGIPHWGSNYGNGLDFLAPGTLLPSTDPVGSTGYSQYNSYQSDASGSYIFDAFGTSMSSPFAAGIASLVWAANPGLKNYQVRHIMQQTAVPLNGIGTGHGSLNAFEAVKMAQGFNPNTDFLLPNLSLNVGNSFSVGINSILSITAQVVNTGDIASSNTTLTYFIDGSPASSLNIPSLSPEQAHTFTINIPTTSICNGGVFDQGIYTLNFDLDPNNQVSEFNEFNRFRTEVDIISLPDLVTINGSISGSLISFELKNIGQTNLQYDYCGSVLCPFYRFYWSTDATISPDDTGFHTMQNSFQLCPQQVYPKQFTQTPPTGVNYLLIKIDNFNSIEESNEKNNVYVLALNNKKEKFSKTNFAETESINLQIIPNPLLQEGKVKYTLTSDSQVSVAMYDLMGSKVQSILPSEHQAAGSYEIPFRKAGLASGIYLIEVLMDGKRMIEKIVVQ